jgi:hypothetical protein
MLELIAIGIVLYGVLMIVYVYYHDYVLLKPSKEAFANPVPESAFRAKVTPGGNDAPTVLAPAPAMDPLTETLLASSQLPAFGNQEAMANFGMFTSERCYRADKGEVLKKTRNYLQRTNNYRRTHPDSCSAPNHEFVGTFYGPSDGIGSTPETGTNIPLSATCLRN